MSVYLPPGTIPRTSWGARPAKRRPHQIGMSSRPGVELHHSVGIYSAGSAEQWAASMQADHLGRTTPNYSDVWYSLGIWTDGQIIELRGTQYRSAPTDALTVCLAGNYDRDPLHPAQVAAIQTIRRWAAQRGAGLALTDHGQRAAVGCAGRNVRSWIPTAPNPIEDEVTQEQADRIEAKLDRIEAKIGDRGDRVTILGDLGRLRRDARRALIDFELVEGPPPDGPYES